jgi:hypothetical protein
MKLFHYVQVVSAVIILREGVIRCSAGKTPPYVWLSSNPTNEPTARRITLSSAQFSQCDAHALAAFEWARFVFDGCDATPWADLGLKPTIRRNLKHLAKHKGGRAQDWFALPYDIPCRDLPLEIQTLEGSWRETGQDDLARSYEDLEVTLDDIGRVIPPIRTRRRG